METPKDRMYEQYRRNELVHEAINSVIEKVTGQFDDGFDLLNHMPDYESPIEEDVEYHEDHLDAARTHWIQLQKSNKQNMVVRTCFLIMLEKYPHLRPIWAFAKHIEERNGKHKWKHELNDDFYFRHHCAAFQSAMDLILKNKDDPVVLRKILHEMGGHHLFYDACEPHLHIFQESFIASIKKCLRNGGGEAMDEQMELSWSQLLDTIRTQMSEGIEIQRNNYLVQCLTPIEMEDIRTTWKSVQTFGFEKAGVILCDAALKKYSELTATYNLNMPLPEAARKDSSRYTELSLQIMKAIDKTIKSYTANEGFASLIDEMQGFVVKFLVVDVSPPLVRKSFTEGLIVMICQILQITHLKEDLLHVWNKIYRVMEQAMIANIVEY